MKDYIIVGQGIAGSVMAMNLFLEKRNFIVIDEPSLSSCSKVAAGLYNPIVFKRLTKSWNIDMLLPAAIDFYSAAEKMLDQKFFQQKNIIRFFTEEQEKALWKKKAKGAEGKYLSPEIDSKAINGTLYEGDYAEVKHSGYLDVNLFLDSLKKLLHENNLLREEKFDYGLLKVQSNGISYSNVEAKHIIFCEGYRAIENPHFPGNAFKLTKGEVLTLRIEKFQQEKIINKGLFILPVGNNIYKAGATYEWNEINEEPTEKGNKEISDKLKKVISLPFEILEHKAGIRPTVTDRRPVIGTHPVHKQLAFLNGMGTKGVMLAPYYANELIQLIEAGIPVNPEADIKRFF